MSNEEGGIVITRESIEALREKRGEEKPALLESAVELSGKAKMYFEDKLSLADNDLDYLMALTGLINYGTYDGVKWMFDELLPDESLDMSDLLHDLSETFGEEITEVVEVLKRLREKMAGIEKPDDKNVVIVLKATDVPKIKTRRGFYVLASLASSQQMSTDRETGSAQKTGNGRQLVFLKPNFVACVEHTCATLYKQQKEGGGDAHYFDIHTRVDMKNGIVLDKNGVAQFVITKDDLGNNITQDVETYMLYALAIGIDSRVYRKMIPDTY